LYEPLPEDYFSNHQQQKQMKQHIITAILATTLTTVPVSLHAEDKEKPVKLSEIPAAASAAIQKHVAGGQIVKVEQDEEKGKVSYEARIKSASGKVSEVTVNATGKLLAVEDVIDLTEAPGAVRTAIEKEAAGGKVEKVERVKEDGKTTYEALISANGKREEVVFSDAGKVVERENKTGKKD
jgi:uncharacterized membrane protein YkoI